MKRNQMIKLMEYPLTDAGNAARLHEIFGKKWVYMPKFRKWMQWDGHCLQTVKAETLCLRSAGTETAAGHCELAAAVPGAIPYPDGGKRAEKTAYGGVKRNAPEQTPVPEKVQVFFVFKIPFPVFAYCVIIKL